MTLASDLASAFGELELTVPVSYGGASARGFFDRKGTIRKVGGIGVQVQEDTLYLIADGIPGLVADTQIMVGELGAATADGGTLYLIAQEPQVLDDGMLVAIQLTGGPS